MLTVNNPDQHKVFLCFLTPKYHSSLHIIPPGWLLLLPPCYLHLVLLLGLITAVDLCSVSDNIRNEPLCCVLPLPYIIIHWVLLIRHTPSQPSAMIPVSRTNCILNVNCLISKATVLRHEYIFKSP